MTKYKSTELNENFRKNELNNYSNALQKFKAESRLFEQKKRHYTDVVYNQCWRRWFYTQYDKFIQDLLDKNNMKDFDIINYNDSEVYKSMRILDDEFYRLFSVSKEVIKFLKPESLEDLAVVFTTGDTVTSGKHLFETLKQKNVVPEQFNKILESTHNQILFNEQIKEILYSIYENNQDVDFIYNMINEIKYVADRFHIMKEYEKAPDKFSILNYIKENYPQYYSMLKVAYISVEGVLGDTCIAEKIFNMMLYGAVISCDKKHVINCAKQFYKVVKIISE